MVHANFKLADPSLLITKGWINDAEVDSHTGKSFDVRDPGSGDVWTTVSAMDAVDTDKAVAAATAAFPAFAAISARQRARMILKLDELVRENKEDLAQLLVMESGKALPEARAEVDYAGEQELERAGGLTDAQPPTRGSWPARLSASTVTPSRPTTTLRCASSPSVFPSAPWPSSAREWSHTTWS